MNNEISSKILSDLTLLLIIPNEQYRNELSNALQVKVNEVMVAESIQEGVTIYNTHKIDFILSELILEEENSLNFCKSLRNINKTIPIILLGSIIDTKVLLEMIKLNLTEYIVKPVKVSVLKEALETAATQIYDNGMYEVSFGDVNYNIRKKYLYNQETQKEIVISANEIKLLDLLIYNKNIVLTKDSIMESIWDHSYEISDEAFKSLLNRLRQKIGKNSIKNISGTGYILNR